MTTRNINTWRIFTCAELRAHPGQRGFFGTEYLSLVICGGWLFLLCLTNFCRVSQFSCMITNTHGAESKPVARPKTEPPRRWIQQQQVPTIALQYRLWIPVLTVGRALWVLAQGYVIVCWALDSSTKRGGRLPLLLYVTGEFSERSDRERKIANVGQGRSLETTDTTPDRELPENSLFNVQLPLRKRGFCAKSKRLVHGCKPRATRERGLLAQRLQRLQ